MAAISNYTLSDNFDAAGAAIHNYVQSGLKDIAKAAMVALNLMQADKTYDEQIDQVKPVEIQERFKRVIFFKECDIYTTAFNAASVLTITTIAFGILGVYGLPATCILALFFLTIREIASRALAQAEKEVPSSLTKYVKNIATKLLSGKLTNDDYKPLNQSALETWATDHNIQLTQEQKDQYIQRRPNYYTLNWGPVEFVVLKNASVSLDLLWDHTFHREQFQVVDAGGP